MSAASSHNGAAPDGLSIDEAAERVGVAPSTLRRWARQGLLPRYDGRWSPPVISHAKIVARLRERGHSLADIRKASDEGRLAYGYVEELFDAGEDVYTVAGDYYGRDVNIASRVGARAAAAEVLVTRPVVEHARGELEFERIADVRLKGFTKSMEIFIAREPDEAV